ncbi:MAG: Hsp20 family protein [Mesorhizobium sp.]|uniref:Hsp20/alpha crystallin family protein n=1 Tax=unclassified Mesorhizobium TaxID=325217 RepID=UPI000F75E60E|nr:MULTISPECIES: Hsp20/alpha crystallin family protein [unclassified Mesorhizobium]RVD72982.1 Hsp20 family protein [Mesorhizobium sp. M4A.F.Ca.ET.029.04.2.1]AZO48879.1 Hsp20/alpha crystallin family protein [Mesorhizobium sp. M4B.F.Ca.ET.058.02.1.1]RVD40920.1 Hsp20 family protein [Mesorhizobium sp. M4A.F.Ca.ET.020.02.1.1]RWC59063.1 MAG: Hsp20 family protein [Mesorhizobium sp.]TIU69603.1 MAG: Hsp20 family protein [Mesorhizobium sp.]
MSVRDLIPWSRGNGDQLPSVFRDNDRDPFLSLHREVNRLFDDVFRGFDSSLPALGRASSFGGGWPSVEISDGEKAVKVTAEVPGLEEKDIEVLLDDGVLTLKGEKRSEMEDKDRQFSERYYGRFERRIRLGYEVEEDKIDARFKNGVLTVTLPKTAKAQSQAKRIEIKH